MQRVTSAVWEWISYFIPHITERVITYPCWDLSQSMLVKGTSGVELQNSGNVRKHKKVNSLNYAMPWEMSTITAEYDDVYI